MTGQQSRQHDRLGPKLAISAIAGLATIGVGAAAAEYAVSEINPIYYREAPSRPATSLFDRSAEPDVSLPPIGAPTGDYYVYRAEPTRAVYGPYPTHPAEPDISDRPSKPALNDPVERLVATTDEPLDAQPAVDTVAPQPDAIGEGGKYGAERVPPADEAQD